MIQQKGIDLNTLLTSFDSHDKPVFQLSSQKQEAEQRRKEEEEKAAQSQNDVFNKEDLDEVWLMDDAKNEENEATEAKEEQQLQHQQEIIAKNSQITAESRNFRGAAFSAVNCWRTFFFVYNRLVGEGFGYTLAVRIGVAKLILGPNCLF